MRWLLMLLLLIPSVVFGVELWNETFDSYNDYDCCEDTCGDPTSDLGGTGSANYTGSDANPNCDPVTRCDITGTNSCGIHVRSVAGRSGKGFRVVHIQPEGTPQRDSRLIYYLSSPVSSGELYLRWYMRHHSADSDPDDHNYAEEFGSGNYQKLIRIDDANIIFDWDYSSGILDVQLRSNGSDYHQIPTYNARSYIVDDQWHCYEIMMDFTNEIFTFWFDDMHWVTYNSSSYPGFSLPSSMQSIHLHGNTLHGHPAGSYSDYDDVIVDTERIYSDGATTTSSSAGSTTSSTVASTTTTTATISGLNVTGVSIQ